MKLAAFSLLVFPLAVSAACVGSPGFQTCTDQSGNNYQVHRFGGSTSVYGSNPNTGSSWSQQSHSTGNMSSTYGNASNGQSWNSTTVTSPGMVQQFGTDSKGRSFSRTCTAAGCF